MKKTTLFLLGLMFATGASAQDIKKPFSSATANSTQSGEEAKYVIDGDYSTIWHSSYGGVTGDITLTVNMKTAEHVDYLRYTPRPGGGNGDWNEVTLQYKGQETNNNFVEIGTYSLGSTGTSYDFILPDGGLNAKTFRFIIKSAGSDTGKKLASAAEIEAFEYDYSKQEAFAAYFADALCTQLKPGVTSSEGIADADVKQLVDNLLADAEGYKKFRVGEYEAYRTTSSLQKELKTSSQYCNYENPTGIYLKAGETVVAIAEGIGEDPVQLKIKNWVADEKGSAYRLRNGVNVVTAATEGNVFVGYYTDNYATAPNVKVHLVNAPVLGYWDQATMTNNDWKEMLKGHSTDDNTIIITRSEHAQTAFPIGIWKQYCPEDINGVMTHFEEVQKAEREMMGLDKFGRQAKNRQLFYGTTYGFMAAGGEGAYCHVGSLKSLMSPNANDFAFWAVGHEWGHNNQIIGFKWSGCTETTNNIYASWAEINYGNSNWLRLEDEVTGVNDYSGMRGGRMQTYFEEHVRKGVAWQLADGPDYYGNKPETKTVPGMDANGNYTGPVTTTSRNYDHFVKLTPFWQMNLWGTLAGKRPDIIPMTIEAIRRDPNYTATYNTNGKQQINWMKLACDSAQLNLLPFFEKAGMLRPINAYIEDYSAGWNIINEKMINNLKAYVAGKGYPTPTEEINYINGHNYHIYRDCLKLEVPDTPGKGCTLEKEKVTVQHSVVKNAVAFETYNAGGELVRITMYGLGSDANHSYTQVLYPKSSNPKKASAYIMAVGYDGTRKKIFEHESLVPGLIENAYYRITSSEKGGALSCGANTSVADGAITWKMARATKSNRSIDQIWQWQTSGDETFKLYNPQSGLYLSTETQTQLYPEKNAAEWKATYVEGAGNEFVFGAVGTDRYINASSETATTLWRGGVGDLNNIWTVEQVTAVPVTIPSSNYANVCYPFPLEIPAGMKAYVVSATGTYGYEGTNYDYALMEEIAGDIIPARMPVLLCGENGSHNLTIAEEDGEKTSAKNLLHGTTLKATMEKGSYLSTTSATTDAGAQALIKAGNATSVAANKSYLLKAETGNAEQLYLDLRGLHDGIGSIKAEQGSEKFYDLNGVQAGKLQKGHIYVTPSGKKILVK